MKQNLYLSKTQIDEESKNRSPEDTFDKQTRFPNQEEEFSRVGLLSPTHQPITPKNDLEVNKSEGSERLMNNIVQEYDTSQNRVVLVKNVSTSKDLFSYDAKNRVRPSSKQEEKKKEQEGPPAENAAGGNEQQQEWWPMKIGKLKDELNDIATYVKPNEYDVYPLSIYYERSAQGRMKFYRLISLLICIYAISPFSIYYKDSKMRFGFFANDLKELVIPISEMPNTFTATLTNCKVHWYTNEDSPDSVKFQMGYDFKSNFTSDGHSFITIDQQISAKAACIVNVFFPPSIRLPNFVFLMNGTLENPLFDDNNMDPDTVLNFTSLQIIGETAFITLHNHYITNLFIELHNSLCDIHSVQSLEKQVFIYTGYYNEYISVNQTSTFVTANQNQGLVCLVAPVVQSLSMDTSCLDNSTGLEFLDINGVSNISCNQEVNLCASAYHCDYPQSYYSINLADGPIQIRLNIDGSYQTNYQMMTEYVITGNIASIDALNVSSYNYETDTADDMISIFQTVGIDYSMTWFYTNKIPYLEALVWPLSWASLTLLRPSMEYKKVIVIDTQCPARGTTDLMNYDMNTFYETNMPQQTQTGIALVTGYSKFYYIEKNKIGKIIQTPVAFTDDMLMVVAFALSAAISLLGAGFICSILYQVFKVGKKTYSGFIATQRHLAYTRQQAFLIETKGSANIETLTYEQNQIIEQRGLFTAKFEKSSFKSNNQKKSLNQINFSIFQVPAIYIDFLFRKRANSFAAFLNAIDESKYHFTTQKMKSHKKDDVSIPVEELDKEYSNFCARCGYKQLNIKDQEQTLEYFQLELDYQNEKQKAAYCYIRFKTSKEKEQQASGAVDDGGNSQSQSLISVFLGDECVQSSFKDDYIFLDKLQSHYIKYCDIKNKPESDRQQIINSDEIKSFGASISMVTPPPIIIGIKVGKLENSARKTSVKVNMGLVRKPINMKSASFQARAARYVKSLFSDLFQPEKPLANFFIVALHFIIIIIFPILYACICFFSLSEITRIQGSVYGEPITFWDVVYPNSLDPFYYNTPYFKYFCYAMIYLALYLLFSFLELLSFYITNYDNQGKFPIKYNMLKKVCTRIYQGTLLLLLFIIMCQFMMTCVWAILGAIMNPQKFLPYATASITFFGVVLAKYAYYLMKYQMVVRQVQSVIAVLMDQLVGESIQKLEKMMDAASGSHKSKSMKDKMNYNADIRGFFKIEDGEKSKGQSNITDVSELAKVTSARLGGLQPTIIEACLAVQAGNKFELYNSLDNLATEFNMDKELMENITELSLSDYNPDQFGIREPHGLVVVSIKRLFRRLFSSLNVELFGDLIQIVTEGDTRPISTLLEAFTFDYKNLFEALIFSLFADSEPKRVNKKLLSFINDIAEQNNNKDIYDKFKILYKLQAGQIDSILENLDTIIEYREDLNKECETKTEREKYKKDNVPPVGIANTIGFSYNFPLMCMIALQKANSSLSRNIINQTFKEIIVEQGLLDKKIKIKYNENMGDQARFNSQANQLYQCLYLIIKGRDIDFGRFTQQQEDCEVNQDNLEELHQVSMNNPQSFEYILNVMQCTQRKDILVEFYTIMQKSPFKAINFCDTFAIPVEKGKTVSLLILLLYRILKFEGMMEKLLPKADSKLKAKDKINFSIHVQKMVDTVMLIEDRESLFTSDMKSKLSAFLPKDEKEEEDVKDDASSVNDGASSHGGENSKGEGSQKSEEEKQEEELDAQGALDEQAVEKNKKEQNIKEIKKIIKGILHPTKQFEVKGKKGYKLLWDLIYESDQIQNFLSDEASQIMRCYAIVMLKTDNFLLPTDKEYIKCFRILAQFFDVQNEKMELLIDLVSGDPLQIFKVFSKNLGFDPTTLTFYNAKFDQTRLNLLSILLQSNVQSLQKVCGFWYQEYLIINQAYQALPILLRTFNIRAEFIKILAMYQVSQSENHDTFNQYEYTQMIISYLKGGLKQSKKSLSKKMGMSYFNHDEGLYTDKYFQNLKLTEVEKRYEEGMRIKDPNWVQVRDFEVIQDYVDFQVDKNSLTRMEELLAIKQGSKKILWKFFSNMRPGETNNYIKIMSAMLQVSSFSTPNTILDYMQTVSERIPLFDEFKDEDSRKCSARNQNLFVQLNLILNSFSFQNMCRNSEINEAFMNNSIINMVALANKSNKEAGYDEIVYTEEPNFYYIIKNLYEQDYFKDIAVQLFSKIGDFTPKQCNFILGLFLGGTLQNASLLRQSLVSLLAGHQVNLTFVKGISGVLMGDLTASNDIKVIARQLDLDGQLIINILDLTNKRTEALPQIIYDLFSKNQSDQVLVLTSLIYAIKKDVTNVKPIANKLGVDANLLIPVLAAAVGKTSILSTFYQQFADIFHISNHNSVRFSVEISKGLTSCISELQNKKSKLFYIPEPELFEAVIYLLNSGQQIYGQKNASGSLALKLEGALAHLYKKLRKAFTFDTLESAKGQSKRLNEALHLLFNVCWGDYQSFQILYKRLRGKEAKEQSEENKNEIPEPVKSIWLKDNPDLDHFKGDKEFIANYELFQKLKKTTKQKLIRTKLSHIANDFDDIQSQIKELQCNMIEILKTNILPELNRRFADPSLRDRQVEVKAPKENKDISPNKMMKDIANKVLEQKIIDPYTKLMKDIDSFAKSNETKLQLKKGFQGIQLYEAAFKTGCTFGITLFKKLRQPFFYCVDCNSELDDDALGICIICALVCHNGHQLKPGNYGQSTKIICDCGSGKFNSCSKFLNMCPLDRIDQNESNTNDAKSCMSLRKHFRKVQEDLALQTKKDRDTKINEKDSKPDNLIKTENQKIEEILQYYTNEMFFKDLASAVDIPDYFGDKKILQSVFDKDRKEFTEGSMFSFSEESQLIGLKDELIGRNISLIENLVLLSSGRSTDSFVTLLTSKGQFKYEHYQNQLIYSKASKKGKVSKTQGAYNALSCFIAMVQGDNQRFQRYGQGYVDALGESGSKEVTAKDKICNILRISNGGKLPQYVQVGKVDKNNKAPKVKANGYMTTFQRLFGVHGQKVIALHKLLTLKKDDLIKISMEEGQDFKDNPELKNVQDWVNNNLYDSYLQLEGKNVEWIKTIIRLCCEDMDAFNFIVQEKKIPPLKAGMYKAILTANKYDLQPIFDKLKTFIPYGLNKFMNSIWCYDRRAIVEFVFRYAEVDRSFQKSWKDVDFKAEVEQYEGYKHNKNYMFNLFSLMSGETLLLGEKMSSLICQLSKKEIEFQKEFFDYRTSKLVQFADCNMSDFQMLFDPDRFFDTYPHIYRLTYAMISMHGVFTDNVMEIPQMARYFDKDKKLISTSEAMSLISICNKCWNQPDVEYILNILMDIEEKDRKEIDPQLYQLAKQILQASEGELECIGKVSDEVFANDNCHIRSLLVSAITGNTKFDYLDDLPENNKYGIDVQGRRNLLQREMYYIYEKITRVAFDSLMQDQKESKEFLDFSFTQKIPLHLFCILSENYNMVSKLFDPTVEFCSNLNSRLKKNKEEAQQQYLSIFLDFLDPYTLTSNIKPILRTVLNIEAGEKMFITVKKLAVPRTKEEVDAVKGRLNDLDQFADFRGIDFSAIDQSSLDMNLVTNLYKELHVSITKDNIKIEMIALIELVMQCFQGDKKSFISLYNVFYPLFDNIPVLANLFSMTQKLLQGKKNHIFNNLPAVAAIIIDLYKRQLLSNNAISDKDKQLIASVVSWMETIMIILDKENNYDNQVIRDKLTGMVTANLSYYDGADDDNPFKDNKQNVTFIVDVIQGIMSLAKQNFEDMQRMAMKIGGFPPVDKLNEFFKITGKHSEMLVFRSASSGDSGDKKDDKDADSEAKTYDARGMFDYFSKSNNGYIGIEEFKNVCKNIGMKGGSRELRIFAKVDTKHSGALNFYQFSKALIQIQLLVVEETIESMGLSINDMVLEFVWAIVLLLMVFIFIFIGIEAFAPVTSFSSVLNSTLLGGSGGFVNGSSKDDQNKSDPEATASAAGDVIGGTS